VTRPGRPLRTSWEIGEQSLIGGGLLCASFGLKGAWRVVKLGGRDGQLLQVVFGKHRVKIGDLLLCCLPGVHGAVVVGAGLLPGGDLGWGGCYVEAHLHHADHGVEGVVEVEEGLQRIRVGSATARAAAAGRHRATDLGQAGIERLGLRGDIVRQFALHQSRKLALDGIDFVVTCIALLHAFNG
jgi:hypothetical protein